MSSDNTGAAVTTRRDSRVDFGLSKRPSSDKTCSMTLCFVASIEFQCLCSYHDVVH